MRGKLLKLRQEVNLTQRELAKKLGITRAWYNWLENDRVRLTKRLERRLCLFYQCSPNDLKDCFERRTLGEK